ncbi:MAG TPA: GyrI-like domain-containing protein [Caulobacterales bacterium]|jgi:hypothetical protein|nr:GyrI-like domain-containing protein [Caulobacterales bacterium]
MKALGKILGTLIVIAIVVIGAGFFLLPKSASQSQTVSIAKPAANVYALLASTPAGEKVGEGITQTVRTATPPDTVVFDLDYGGGVKGEATYKVVSKGEAASDVVVKVVKPVGDAPMDRIGALTGAPAAPVLVAAVQTLKADSGNLTDKTFAGLEYELVDLDAQPLIYAQGTSSLDAAEIKKYVALALKIVDQNVSAKGLRTVGRPLAVEDEWDEKEGTYKFYAGYRLSGATPKGSAGVGFGKSPGGTAIKVLYKGDEAQVLPTYDKMEALIAAARLVRHKSFEVYNDDPEQVGGSADREIYYLVEGDVSQLAKILPPKAPLTVNVPEAPSAAPPQ